jgi:hypothetical protein
MDGERPRAARGWRRSGAIEALLARGRQAGEGSGYAYVPVSGGAARSAAYRWFAGLARYRSAYPDATRRRGSRGANRCLSGWMESKEVRSIAASGGGWRFGPAAAIVWGKRWAAGIGLTWRCRGRCRLPCRRVLSGWSRGRGSECCGPRAGRDTGNGMCTSRDHEILES